ncbi:O-antigen ligase family protein [Flavisphingomonas formosensis]|uniref:O-antigen ligase family protein n=1 Tax=Flavisphingomonas formosensis TaxID=861534 RepID=UPI0012F87681|nr:O-antigen ligase family protein [Sphingomonas formosensis]
MLRLRTAFASHGQDSRRHRAPPRRDSIDYWSLVPSAVLLVVALIFGGGGAESPATELLVELVAIAVLMIELSRMRWSRVTRPVLLAFAVLGLILLVPLIQLVPLPPALWTGLPGRGVTAQIAKLLGDAGGFRPLSLDPDMTLRSALSLLPGIAMFVAALRLDVRETHILMLLTIGIALVSIALGAVQLAMGPNGTAYLYLTSHQGLATGFFANRNHQGTFLVMAFLATAAISSGFNKSTAAKAAAADQLQAEEHGSRASSSRRRTRRDRGPDRAAFVRIALWCTLAICAVGTLATASRTASALLVLAIGLTVSWYTKLRTRARPLPTLLVVLAIVAFVTLLFFTQGVQTLLDRYQSSHDARYEFWPDVVYAVKAFFPLGAGMGAFDPAFKTVEQLSIVSTAYVNDAHNDYLQILVETGIVGPIVILMFVAYLIYAAARMRASGLDPIRRTLAIMGIYGILLLMLHSIVDYPLRTLALETVFAFLCAQVVIAARDAKDSEPQPNDAGGQYESEATNPS